MDCIALRHTHTGPPPPARRAGVGDALGLWRHRSKFLVHCYLRQSGLADASSSGLGTCDRSLPCCATTRLHCACTHTGPRLCNAIVGQAFQPDAAGPDCNNPGKMGRPGKADLPMRCKAPAPPTGREGERSRRSRISPPPIPQITTTCAARHRQRDRAFRNFPAGRASKEHLPPSS
jgi:hypothetical protein